MRRGIARAAAEMASGDPGVAAEWSFAPDAIDRLVGAAPVAPAASPARSTAAATAPARGMPAAAKSAPHDAAVVAVATGAAAAATAAAAAAKAADAAAALVSGGSTAQASTPQAAAPERAPEPAAATGGDAVAPAVAALSLGSGAGDAAPPADEDGDGDDYDTDDFDDESLDGYGAGAGGEAAVRESPVAHSQRLSPAPVSVLEDGVSSLRELLAMAHAERRRGVLVYWRASWNAASVAGADRLSALAVAAPSVRCALVDVSASDAPMALALAHVLRPSLANRSRLVLRPAMAFPLVTLFPAMEDVEEALGCGKTVSRADEAAIAAAINGLPRTDAVSADAAGTDEVRDDGGVADSDGEGGDEGGELDGVIYITEGAANLKAVLREADAPVIVLWVTEEGDEDDQGEGTVAESNEDVLERLVSAVAASADPYYVAMIDLPSAETQDASEVEANGRLAAALGVKRTPQAHTYRGMKLSDSHVGPDAIRLFCSAIEGAGVSSGADGGSQDSAASEGRGADGTGEDFSPPPQAEWKTATRRFRAGKADFYAKYPCLRCGQAWWVGTDWGGRCARCGAKDTSGYDANEKPLPNREADYRRFVRMLRAGEVPPYSKA